MFSKQFWSELYGEKISTKQKFISFATTKQKINEHQVELLRYNAKISNNLTNNPAAEAKTTSIEPSTSIVNSRDHSPDYVILREG